MMQKDGKQNEAHDIKKKKDQGPKHVRKVSQTRKAFKKLKISSRILDLE